MITLTNLPAEVITNNMFPLDNTFLKYCPMFKLCGLSHSNVDIEQCAMLNPKNKTLLRDRILPIFYLSWTTKSLYAKLSKEINRRNPSNISLASLCRYLQFHMELQMKHWKDHEYINLCEKKITVLLSENAHDECLGFKYRRRILTADVTLNFSLRSAIGNLVNDYEYEQLTALFTDIQSNFKNNDELTSFLNETLQYVFETRYICPTRTMIINSMIDKSYEGYLEQHPCSKKLNSLKFDKKIRIPYIECSLIFSNNCTENHSAAAEKIIKEKFNLDKRKMSEVALEVFSGQENLVNATIDISHELLSFTGSINRVANEDNSIASIYPAPFDGKLPATTDTPCIPIDALLTLGF